MRKIAVAVTLISALLIIGIAGTKFINLVKANPYIAHESVSSPVEATIIILSPENNKLYASNNLTLNLDVKIDNSSVWIKIMRVYYQTNWQEANVTVYEWKYYDLYNLDPSNDDPVISEYACELNLTGIPEGKQNVTVSVIAEGGYAENLIYYSFNVFGSKKVTFVIDSTPTESFPVVPVAAASAVVAVAVIAGLLVYFKKRKH